MMTVLDSTRLLPDAWRNSHSPKECYFFNPAVVLFRGRLILAYRVVTPDRVRRIAVCEVDAKSFQPKPGTIVALSDMIANGGQWHADPRFCVYKERLYLHYNDGWRENNRIFILEIDPVSLLPRSPARALNLEGSRQSIEKNWQLFEHDGEILAVYSIVPHIILHVDLAGDGPVRCRRRFETLWDAAPYAERFGELRGGTPPVKVDGILYSFFHSFHLVDPIRRQLGSVFGKPVLHTLRYVAGLYGFSATPPFQPVLFTPAPILQPDSDEPRCRLPPLDPRIKSAIYPSGTVWTDGKWVVSYGSGNEFCCLRTFSHEALLGSCNRIVS